MVAFLISPATCRVGLKFLRSQPCDVHENTTTGTLVFNCRGRGLKYVPNVLRNATSLDLSENNIGNLTMKDLKGLQKLIYLNLGWMNQDHGVNITTRVFANLTSLQMLLLNGAGLKHVPNPLPMSINKLILLENRITRLNASSFSDVKNLTHLNLSKNCYYWNYCFMVFQIENGTFSTLTKLRHLSLSYNNLTYVPRGLPVSLITLDLASNSLRYIGKDDFSKLLNLKTLKIQGNCPRCQNAPFPCIPCPNGSIEIHEQAFDHLRKLKLLHLAGNSLEYIKKSWFKNIWKLQELYLSYNLLTKAIEDGGFLSNLPLLRKLDLSFNYNLKSYPDTVKLGSSFANLSSLHTLHIQGLVFKSINQYTLSPLYDLQNLSTLDLGINFIVHVNSSVFKLFQNLKLLYLSENRLYPITNSEYRKSGTDDHLAYNLPMLTSSKKEQSFEIQRKLVKMECYAAGRVLDLSRNNLFFISPQQFVGYETISCLNLSGNGFSAALNGTEFASLSYLKYLDLSFNKIDLAYDNAFKELNKLEVLDLSFNPHYFTVPGVTHNLQFLKNLPFLRVLNMSNNGIFTLTTKQMYSDSLNELQFQHNYLGKLWKEKDETYDKIFQNLKNLTHLDISYNNINKIPYRVYTYLPDTMKRLRLAHNDLTSFNWTLMRRFKHLEELILSSNYLLYISKNISVDIPSLHYLDLSHNKISQLSSGFLLGAVNLHWLDVSYNRLATINQSTFPSKAENHLRNLWLHGNPFRCTCDIMDFILWIYQSDMKIPKLATSVKCSRPDIKRGKGVIFFDIKECIDDHLAFLAYFCSTLLILVVTFVATVMHLFYWDVSYLFYYLKATFKGYQDLNSEDCMYDAFITYDTKDPQVSEWVLNHLRFQLEEQGEHLLPVCLEERDWMPGCPMLDSLNQSIRQSRKTVFVLTHSYVNSGSFKMSMYLAHQRLLDESKDVIVLLLLEPVLQNSHFLRLRRRLCSQSVLEWPRTPAAEPWFWQCLRNAIRIKNNVMYNKMYSKYFSIVERPGIK
ncbi:toll-like receptor 8 [Trichomycterus rosablanca]|uniref:toll-like receptor 8 n=1 Tax=Trichomycterus rosablanca TaxID=2290929 RepID=UPI002F3529EC